MSTSIYLQFAPILIFLIIAFGLGAVFAIAGKVLSVIVGANNPSEAKNETFECGEWAIKHSKCVIFHDTLSFREIMRVCEDLSIKHNLEFYNYGESHGLGILINNSL